MSDNMYDPYCFKSKQSSPLPITNYAYYAPENAQNILLVSLTSVHNWLFAVFFLLKLRRDRVGVLTKEKIGTRRGREKGVASTRSPNPFSSVSPLAFCINVFEGINTHQTPREMPGYKQSCIQLPRVINISCILLHLLSAVYDRNQEKYMALR